jgi:hypothetical protein
MEACDLPASKLTVDEKSLKSTEKSLLTTLTPEVATEIRGRHCWGVQNQKEQVLSCVGVVHAAQGAGDKEPHSTTHIVPAPESKWNNRENTTESGRVTPVPDAETVEQSNSIGAEGTKSASEEGVDVAGSGDDNDQPCPDVDTADFCTANAFDYSEGKDYDMMEYGSLSLDGLRQHHLLRHSLPSEQRGQGVLAHFGVDTISEAAKLIKKMSQRDLQAKFKTVYGARTFSNNNNWLRRKLFEAIGLDPSKGAVKKPGAGGQRRRRTGVSKSVARSVAKSTAIPRNTSPRIPRRSRMRDDLTDHTVAEALLALGDYGAGLGEAVEGAGDSFVETDIHGDRGDYVIYTKNAVKEELRMEQPERFISSEQRKKRVAVLRDVRESSVEDRVAPKRPMSRPLPISAPHTTTNTINNNRSHHHHRHHDVHQYQHNHPHQQDALAHQAHPQIACWDPEALYEWMIRVQRHAMEINPPLPHPSAMAPPGMMSHPGLEGAGVTSVVVPPHYPTELYHRMMHEAAMAMSLSHQISQQPPPALFAAQGQ